MDVYFIGLLNQFDGLAMDVYFRRAACNCMGIFLVEACQRQAQGGEMVIAGRERRTGSNAAERAAKYQARKKLHAGV